MRGLAKAVVMALVAVVLVVVVALHLWLDTLIKTSVERVGPRVTGSPVTLKDVDIGLLTGRVELDQLMIGNPKGYQAPAALKIGAARMRVQLSTVLSNPVVIDEVMINGPEVTYEGILSKSNVATILKHAESVASTSTGPPPTPSGPPGPSVPAKRSAPRRFIIKELHVTNGRVAVWVGENVLGEKSVAVPLPDIHLKDIGSPGGATAAEAGSAVLSALNKASAQAVASAAQPLEKAAKRAGEVVGEGATKAVEGLRELLK